MPAPNPFPALNRQSILASYPWLAQSDQKMVVGTDLDSTLSSILAHQVMGWEPIGFYDFFNIYAAAPPEKLYDAIWLDLDISHPRIRSIGHHILGIDDVPMAVHAQSLNLNFLQGVSQADYRRKYPLGTFHFLAWLWDVNLPIHDPLALPLYWHPDSAWINGQTGHYRSNVLDWLDHCVPVPALLAERDSIDTLLYERTVQPLFDALARCGWNQGPYVKYGISNHLHLAGWQCQFGTSYQQPGPRLPEPQKMNALYNLFARITGWSPISCPTQFQVFQGQRRKWLIATVVNPHNNNGLGNFLNQNRVFSYAFPYKDSINYTQFGTDWNP